MSIKFPHALLLAVIYWAAIYLPGLGSIEIKGEEIRRIIPGVNMLQTGNWIVPQFNGVPYLRKPPLVNWAIAASVKTIGIRNEWSARLPSVLAILAMAVVMLAVCVPWLGPNAALAAVLITLTTAGIVEKGRLAEIEAIYIGLFGMAFSCWLAWSATGRSHWLTWPVTGFLLGLGLLAKGPPHLAFFYAIACFIAWRSSRQKEVRMDTAFLGWAHLAGIILMAAIFALWWIPYSYDPATHGAGGVMARQMEQRIGGGDRSTVFINLLRSLLNFLPWILGLPSFWHRKTLALLQPRDRLIVEATRLPLVVCAFALMLVPGMLPRYTLPLVVPYALMLVLVLKARMGNSVVRLPLAAASLAAVGMIAYAIFFAPRVAAQGASREFAAQVNSQMPAGSPLYIFDPGVQPEVFYIKGRLLFTESVKELPIDVPWILAQDSSVELLRSRYQQSEILAQPREQSGKKFALLSLHGRLLHPPNAPPKHPKITPPVAP